ncbi:MAG TPA: class I SAM-dependent methyltransferase [Syntrophorhabdales bacterium]|nr:class I SAM-dependent methyltransferase [Syntrophorhabdales bacterium]
MSVKYNLGKIINHWSEQAVKHGQSPAASWSDTMVIEMEIREILKHLQDGDRVLDVGCANGYSTLQFATKRKIDIRGLDVVQEMIGQARLRLENLKQAPIGNVEFEVGDITALHEPDGAYDKVIVIRVIINLGNWRNQMKGLRECARVLKPGGTLLLSEATMQGWQQLNKFRNEWGLSDIPMPPFNLYMDQDRVVNALSDDLQVVEIRNFASTYYVSTRVLKPLLTKACGATIDVANPDMEWNRWFAQLPAWGDYGIQKLFVFKKPKR